MSIPWAASAPVTINENLHALLCVSQIPRSTLSRMLRSRLLRGRQVRVEVLKKETDAPVPDFFVQPCPSTTPFTEAETRDKQATRPWARSPPHPPETEMSSRANIAVVL